MSRKTSATEASHLLPCSNGRSEGGERTKIHLPAAPGPKKRQKQHHSQSPQQPSERRKAHANTAMSINKPRENSRSIYNTQEATQRHAAGVENTHFSPPRKKHRTSYTNGEAARSVAPAVVPQKSEAKKTREGSPRWPDVNIASAALQKHLEALGRSIPTSSSSRDTRDMDSHQRQPLLHTKKEKQQQQQRHQGAHSSQLERQQQQQQQHERHTQQRQQHSEQKQPRKQPLTQQQREQQRPVQMQQRLQQRTWPHQRKQQQQQPGKEQQQRSEQRQQQPSKQLQHEEHRRVEQQEQWRKNLTKKQQKQTGKAEEEGRSGRQQQHVQQVGAKLRQQQQQSGTQQQKEKQQPPEGKPTPQQQTAAMKQQGQGKKQCQEAQPSRRQQRQQQRDPQEYQWGRKDTGEKRGDGGAAGAPRRPSANPAAVALPSGLQKRRRNVQQQQWQTGGAGGEGDAAVAATAPQQQQQWQQRHRESEPTFSAGKRRREQQLQHYEEQSVFGGEVKNGCRGKELLQRLQERLKGSRFRSLNEQLYTTTGRAALAAFQQNPDLFKVYHEGYRQQVKQWPLNPLRLIKDWVNTLPHTLTIGDFGCGEAALAGAFPNRKIYSYDLVAATPAVVACNLADLPVVSEFFDVGIFCLSLMGTDWPAFLREAYRVLKNGGRLKIAEVASRFVDCEAFMEAVEALGFTRATPAIEHVASFFVVFEFRKESKHDERRSRTATGNLEDHPHARKKHKSQRPQQLVSSLLKPCIYKRRG